MKTPITKPEDLMELARKQGVILDAEEAETLIGYADGHGYELLRDDDWNFFRYDTCDDAEDEEYRLVDLVNFVSDMNEDLLRIEEEDENSDAEYLRRLQHDEQVIARAMEAAGTAWRG